MVTCKHPLFPGGLNMQLRNSLLALLLLISSPAIADNNSEANRLAVEAKLFVDEATKTVNTENRIKLLKDALKNLNTIVAKYPGSNLAVKIVGGDQVAGITKGSIVRAINKALSLQNNASCSSHPTVQCVAEIIVQSARRVRTVSFGDGVLVQTAEVLVKLGRRSEARQIIRIAQQLPSKSGLGAWATRSALKQAAIGNAIVGNFNSAIRDATSQDYGYAVEALVRIAEIQNRSGDKPGATKTIDLAFQRVQIAPKSDYIGLSLAKVAQTQARLKLTERLKSTTAMAISHLTGRSGEIKNYSDLYRIAQAQVLAGNNQKAFKLIRLLSKPYKQSMGFAEIAKTFYEIGAENHASLAAELSIKLAKKSESAYNKYFALEEAARVNVKVGNYDQAIHAISLIYDKKRDKASEFLKICIDIAELGALKHANKCIKLAKKARSIQNSTQKKTRRISYLIGLSMVHSKLNNWDKATDLAYMISERRVRDRAFKFLAEDLARAGKLKKSMELANDILDRDDASKIKTVISMELAKSGIFSRALKVAKSISDAYYRTQALTGLVEILHAKSG